MNRPAPYLDIPYPGLERTLLYVKEMAVESIPFMESFIPAHINTPEELFYFLKPHLTYKKDPVGIEFIQQAETLIVDAGGYGDCDCFTVLSLAGLHVIGEKFLYTTIAGKTRGGPTHIYASFGAGKKRTPFDLTNSLFGFERPYKFYQDLRTTL